MKNALLAELAPIEKPNLHTEVTTRLAKMIASSQPGTRLPSERELTETLGVSRSTIREGIRSLAFLGAVQVRQGDGIYVSKLEETTVERLIGLGVLIQRSSVHEVIQARQLLEVEVAKTAASNHHEQDVVRLQAIMKEMAVRTPHPSEASRLDLEFHVAIAKASHNSVLVFFIQGMRSLFQIWMSKAVNKKSVADEIVEEHNAIVAALLNRNPEEAGAKMSYHLENASARLLSTMDGEKSMSDFVTSIMLTSSGT